MVLAMVRQQCHTGKDAWRLASLHVSLFLSSADGQPGSQIAECCDSFQHSRADGNRNGGSVSLVHDCGPPKAEH